MTQSALQEFAEAYRPVCFAQPSLETYGRSLQGFTKSAERLVQFSGCSFGGGIYHLLESDEISSWTRAVQEGFPEYSDRIRCFGRDWLCNQFCLDKQRMEAGEALILLFEIGTGKVLKIPETFDSFHSSLIIKDPDAALAATFYGRWRIVDSRPLGADECVGYKVPLFLGGKDELGNLERMNASVYWHDSVQMLLRTRDLPPGTKITGVSGDA